MDMLRIFAIFLVVVLHSSVFPVRDAASFGTGSWWVADIYHSFSRISVPLFVMLSGALLLDGSKKETLYVFFTKRIRKVLVPLLFWGVAYTFWKIYFHGESISLAKMIRQLIAGPVYSHLWFVYMLLGIYLITPLLRVYVNSASTRNIMYFVVLWFLFASVFPIVQKLIGVEVNAGLKLPLFRFMGYFVLGHLLLGMKVTPAVRAMCLLLLISGTIVTSTGTYYLTLNNAVGLNPYMFKYLSPNVVLMSVAAFLLIKSADYSFISKNPYYTKLATLVSQASFGIYLVHLIVLELLSHGSLLIKIDGSFYHPLIGVPLASMIIFSVSCIMVLLLRKVPVLRGVTP